MTGPSRADGVHADIAMHSVDALGGLHHLEAGFGYEPADPFAVTVTFRTTYGDVAWTFARDLLVEGIDTPSGDGDVHVWPCDDADGRPAVAIELESDDGELLVQAPRWAVRRFVAHTLRAVPLGTESALLDLDAVLDALLAT
jgi:hypothetical protein